MTLAIDRTQAVTEPGIYDGMSDETYHADPIAAGSLSSTGARRLNATCPAIFRHEQLNGQGHKRIFDFGHAAHALVLGIGLDIEEIGADSYRTKAAQAQRDAAYAAGKVPLLPEEHQQVKDMAAAIRRHPLAGRLLNPDHGKAEQSLFWVDDETGIWRRARIDWLPNRKRGRRILVDYKTSASVAPTHLKRAFEDYGYNAQAAWYLDGARALDLADENSAFIFVCQMKTEPYLITLAQPHPDALALGDAQNRRAIEMYRDCITSDVWPGYADDVVTVELPPYAVRNFEEQYQ